MYAAIIYDRDFPYEGIRPSEEQIELLKGFGEIIAPMDLSVKLKENDYSGIVNLHGRYFPKDAWKGIMEHLRKGRGFANVGSLPFRYPVSFNDGAFEIEREQTAYHRDLNIRNIFNVTEKFARYEVNSDFELDERFSSVFDGSDISEFTVKFTHSNDKPMEHGSSGPMEANIHTLAYAFSDEGKKIAAPIVMIENTRSQFAGGRWIFYNQNTSRHFWENSGMDLLISLIKMISRPVAEIVIRPGFASYYPGEQPSILLQFQLLGKGRVDTEFGIKITKSGKEVYNYIHYASIDENIKYISIPADCTVDEGFYEIETLILMNGEKRCYKSGFWGYDRTLLESGSRLVAEDDYFTKDGKVFPVTGMTYMASDVHRKFLFMPNPAVWMEDFAFMKGADINLVRTGTWTSFRNVMYVDGIAYEEVMRAFDAFVLTAKYFNIEVVFNFFAFTPEMWEGINPYLDPASVEAQKRYISAIVSRHAKSTNVSWDLINEPSVCNPRKVFSGPKPNGDIYEIKEWRNWLKEKYKDIRKLQEKWNCSGEEFTSFDQVMLPLDKDLEAIDERDKVPHPPTDRTKALLSLDYGMFTNHVLDKWAREMMGVIRSINPGQLVAIGQDHATSGRRPHPFFHGRYMDYTTVHTWWQLDDIYWDSAFVKIPGKPALVQETGIMYVEDNNEMNRRSECDSRDLLERKLAYAFGANTAGVVPWVLNTNIYMNDENEVHIGMLRPDLTEKPEFNAVRGIYKFIDSVKDIFDSSVHEDVYVVYSFSNSYSNRAYANIATRKCSRVLTFNLKTTFFGCGDYDLSCMNSPKLIIYPSPRVIPDATWEALIEKAAKGSVVLITGPANYDEHWAKTGRLAEMGIEAMLKTVSREETVIANNKELRAVFDGQLIGWVDKEFVNGAAGSEMYSFNIGKGKLIWCPLPIEMNREDPVVEEIYKIALSEAGLKNEIEFISGNIPGIFIKKQKFTKGSIYIVISEDGTDREVEFTDRSNGAKIKLKLLSGRSAMIAVDNIGSILNSYGV